MQCETEHLFSTKLTPYSNMIPRKPYHFIGFVYDMQYFRDQYEVKEYNSDSYGNEIDSKDDIFGKEHRPMDAG